MTVALVCGSCGLDVEDRKELLFCSLDEKDSAPATREEREGVWLCGYTCLNVWLMSRGKGERE